MQDCLTTLSGSIEATASVCFGERLRTSGKGREATIRDLADNGHPRGCFVISHNA
jgi:hypothetical protein